MDAFNSFFDLVGDFFVKIFADIPDGSTIFDVSSQISTINTYLGYVNYFVPFGTMSTIFNVYCTALIALLFGLLIVKYLLGVIK